MHNVLKHLEQSNWQTLTRRFLSEEPNTAAELATLNEVHRNTKNHIDDRLEQLAVIAKMMQISSADKDIGGFELSDVTMLGYFLESELATLRHLTGLKDDASFFLNTAYAKAGGSE